MDKIKDVDLKTNIFKGHGLFQNIFETREFFINFCNFFPNFQVDELFSRHGFSKDNSQICRIFFKNLKDLEFY